MTVNTKKAERRQISIASLEQLSNEIDRVVRSDADGTLTTTGNWTPGQIMQHCAIVFRAALDGFPPGGPPAIVRFLAKTFFKKKAISGAAPPPGIRLPKSVEFMIPDDAVSTKQGADELREIIQRIESGDRMTHPSPLLGDLTHDEWMTIQLSHCALHFSFLHPK